MPLILTRLIRGLVQARLWALPAAVAAVVFLTSWPLMAWAEPGNPITRPDTYWWWFVVTASTVGYGDVFPETLGGHLVGVYVIVGGIATLTALFARLAQLLETAKGRRMQGLNQLDLSDHVVILGYAPGRTERIVDELTAEGRRTIALCAWHDQVETDPIPGREDVRFVRGDLTDVAVLRRACVDRARTVLVDARDDDEALSLTVAAHHVGPDVHTVVTLRELGRAHNFSYVDPDVRCVQWHSVRLVTEELQDPGISQVYAELMTYGGGNTYSTPVPEALDGRTFGDFQQALGRGFQATVLAARADHDLLISPAWETPIEAGATLYYVAGRRLHGDDLERALAR